MADTLTLPIKKLNAKAIIPEQAYEGDAGIDLRATESVSLEPFQRALVPTGVAVAIPVGYAGFVLPRSGSAIKQGLTLLNTPGLIDSGYRGELCCICVNLDSHNTIEIHEGDRIAQLVIMKVEQPILHEVQQLSETTRGAGGFGSSGLG